MPSTKILLTYSWAASLTTSQKATFWQCLRNMERLLMLILSEIKVLVNPKVLLSLPMRIREAQFLLLVDNLNGAQVLGRVIRVDHASNYKKKEEEDEETEQKKREERGVCRAFQRGDCNRGAGCKFSHDEQRAANTGWGHQDDKGSKWNHDRFEGQKKSERQSGTSNIISEYMAQETRLKDRDARSSRTVGREEGKESHNKPRELNSRYRDSRDGEKGSEQKEDTNHKEEWEKCAGEKKFRRHDHEPNSREAYDRREEKRSRRHDPDSYPREDRDTREQKRSSRHELESHRSEDRKRARDKWSDHDRDSSFDHHRRIDKESRPRSYR
ncbi:zinc finger CCCH domain-containing protein 25-like isoform X2 [Diospyros lotus]|uniref:zinc finger CCCH domain-containing protein 25-like isoform X2 n=1 Tax=Diospyros lotus TaxID=55363 RepID=UPI00225308C8|nr:zinc finger CCCH domain-containing protein 25-like isoform X2 [Diospyros lotus]